MKQDLASYLELLKETFLSKHLRKVTFYSRNYIFLQFASVKDYYLVINLDNERPSIFRANSLALPPSLNTRFAQTLRKKLNNAKLINIEQINNDLIACFTFLITTPTFIKEEIKLYIELIKSKPNLILVNHENKIIEAKNITSWHSQRFISPRQNYVLPINNGHSNKENILFNFQQFEEEQNNLFIKNMHLRRKEKYLVITHYLKTKINRAKKKIKNIELDQKKAQDNLVYEMYANEILTHYSHLKKGTKKIIINEQIIPLNEQLSPLENAQNFFKIAKKSKKALSLSKALLNEAQKELEYYLEVEHFVNFSNEERIDAFLDKNNFLGRKKTFPPLQYKKEDPYRIIKNETAFYYGKNAFQNDFLTFTLAKKEHTWFHIKRLPSAHLVIFKTNPSKDDLLTAAELLLLLSNLEKGEVIYSLRQNLSRGEKPGQVYVLKYEVLDVTLIRPETLLLLKKAKSIVLK